MTRTCFSPMVPATAWVGGGTSCGVGLSAAAMLSRSTDALRCMSSEFPRVAARLPYEGVWIRIEAPGSIEGLIDANLGDSGSSSSLSFTIPGLWAK